MSNVEYDKSKYRLIMPEKPIRDGNLSLKARGLLALINTNRIFAKHNRWHLYESQIVRSCHADGKTSVQSAFKELEQKGYLEKRQKQDKEGQFVKGTVWIVHNAPRKKCNQKRKANKSALQKKQLTEKPDTENPDTENPTSGKPISNYHQQQLVSTSTNIDNNYNQQQSSSSSMAPQKAPKEDDDDASLDLNRERGTNEQHEQSGVAKPSNDSKNKSGRGTAYSQKTKGKSKPKPEYRLYSDDRENKKRRQKRLIMRKQSSKILPVMYDSFDWERETDIITESLEYKIRKNAWTICGAKPQAINAALSKALRNAKSRTIHSILNYANKCVSAYFD